MNNVSDRQEEIQSLKAQLAEREQRIQTLEELVKYFRQRKFGASSEKISPDQLGLFNEAESIELESSTEVAQQDTVKVSAHERQKKPRVSIPPHLPREVIDYDLDVSEKVCPHDQTPLTHIGTEEHEQLKVIPAQVSVVRHRRHKYCCPCCNQFQVAQKPKQPIEKSIASPELLAYIATQKYCDALPLYRQVEIFKRAGIALDRTNLANWMMRCGELVQPLINLMQEHILSQPVVHMDETTIQVLKEPDKTPQSKSYMWLLASFTENPMIVFHYDPTRQREVPKRLLDQHVSTLMVDGYDGYQQACDAYDITRLGCWAHARRKFVDAQKIQPKNKTGKADQAIAFIQTLYRIEKKCKDMSADERHHIRQTETKPVIDKIEKWLQKSLPHVPPKSKLGEALHYLHNQWSRLIRYLEDGYYPIDNNLAENAIRPFAIGRKNWLFANSQAGAKTSANLYSLAETAKANGLNPYDYFREVFTRLPNAENVQDIEELLPTSTTLTVGSMQ